MKLFEVISKQYIIYEWRDRDKETYILDKKERKRKTTRMTENDANAIKHNINASFLILSD